jgi:molecular chaperone IbpA
VLDLTGKPDEVSLTVEQNVLTLEGRKGEKEDKAFLHRGISARSFKRQFTVADHVEVTAPALLYRECHAFAALRKASK